MRPEEFITQRLALTPLPFWPQISLYLPHAASGLHAWLDAEGHDSPPYWAYVWAGGAALATHILQSPGSVANKTVLDFGSGSGLLGIVAAKLGAAAVFALEADPLAETATALNAQANGVVVTPVRSLLHTDLVLAGDVFYSAEVAQNTLPRLQELHQTGTTVLIGDPFRQSLPLADLREIARYPVPDMGAQQPVETGIFTF